MAKGPRKHLKRLAAPGHWPIRRKERPFTIRTRPGAHALHESIPLAIIVRDLLNLTTTYNETRRVISQGQVQVDGKPSKDYKYAVGLMDVIEIPEVKIRLRVLPAARHLLQLHSIPKKEADIKLCKITGKTTVAKGNIQIQLHDGRNILLPVEDPKAKAKESYQVGDALVLKVPSQAIQDHVPLQEGITAIITGGDHTGFVGKLTKINTETQLGTLQGTNGKTILTALRYVFPVGQDQPIISIPEAS